MKPEQRDDSVYLRHVLDAIAKAAQYLEGVDVQTVWLTAQDDLPVLKVRVTRILETLPPSA
jgi:uncharacterized protein with HEPN domain